MIGVRGFEAAQQELLHNRGWLGRGIVLLAAAAIIVFGFTVGAVVDTPAAVALVILFIGLVWAAMIKVAESRYGRR